MFARIITIALKDIGQRRLEHQRAKEKKKKIEENDGQMTKFCENFEKLQWLLMG